MSEQTNTNTIDRPIVIQASEASKVTREHRFEVLSHGTRLVAADDFQTLIEALTQARELEEQVVAVSHSIECFPLDGIVAFNRALERIFGFTHAKERVGFFGDKHPPQTVNVETGMGRSESVVYGAMQPPLFEGGHISIVVESPLSLGVGGEIRRKFNSKVEEIVALTKEILQKESIYRGGACELSIRHDRLIHPKFIDVSKKIDLILSRETEFELQINVWDPIARPQAFRDNNVPIKHNILLSGPFGTGKSLTSYETAQRATKAGWTYFYLKTADEFVTAYRICQFYAPAILFVEDIDAIASGERNPEMNQILETLDGVTAKNAEIVAVFTTNFPEKINDAFLRSGRIDTHIKMEAPDAEAAARFVQILARDVLSRDVDFERVGESFAGLVPSDISESINKAKRRAIGEFGSEINARLTTEMLATAADVMRRQRGLISAKRHPAEEAIESVRKGLRTALWHDGELEQTIKKAVGEVLP